MTTRSGGWLQQANTGRTFGWLKILKEKIKNKPTQCYIHKNESRMQRCPIPD